MLSRSLPIGATLLLIVAASLISLRCRTPEERRREEARLDSLRNDSMRPVVNPYKLGQGTDQYNRQREALGNLDSLVTPRQPPIPKH